MVRPLYGAPGFRQGRAGLAVFGVRGEGVMSKFLSNFDDYEKATGYTENSFYERFIKPVIKAQKKRKESNKSKITHDFKWAVWKRDNFTCINCGSRDNLSVDHILPESKGGKLTMENTQTLCISCNSKKGAR